MTRSTGRSRASTGRMNTRTLNRATAGACASVLTAAILFATPPVARAAAAEAKSKRTDKGDKNDKGDEAEKTLPPILQKALEEKEAQVTEARREAIRLLEAYLRE